VNSKILVHKQVVIEMLPTLIN